MGSQSAIVVGAGAAGLLSAYQLTQAGFDVCVVDPTPGRGAVWQAAGMLAPVSESHFGEEGLVALLAEAARCWDRVAPHLEDQVGPVGYRACGTLLVALDAGDRAELARRGDLIRSLGLPAEEIGRDRLLELEPHLSPRARSAIFAPEDHQVDNRRLVGALLDFLPAHGVRFESHRVTEVGDGSVVLDDDRELRADLVVLCPGALLSEISGVEGLSLPQVRPVKGQILRLHGAPLLSRTVRAIVHGRPIYLVPRSDGELVVGATVEEMGFDTTVRAGDVHRLLDDARLIAPGIDELELHEASAGLRPGSPDNAPTVRRVAERTIVAVGLYRNGILLAPLCAELVVAIALGQPHDALGLLEAAHA